MGMYAGYYRISDAELEQLRQLEERALLEQAEELTEDETAEACDLDKMWDALHFVLTGDTLSDAADHDPLSEAVCGSVFLARQIHVGGIPSNRVKEIAQALHEVDFAARLAALQMSDFAAAETCPNTCRGAAQFLLCRNTTSRFEELRGLNLYKPCRRIKAGERCSPLPPFVGLLGFVQ